MNRVIAFPVRRPTSLRRPPALRLVAAVILVFFAAAVISTALMSLATLFPSPPAGAPGRVPAPRH